MRPVAGDACWVVRLGKTVTMHASSWALDSGRQLQEVAGIAQCAMRRFDGSQGQDRAWLGNIHCEYMVVESGFLNQG
jgi:hypothetical protein